MAKYQLTVTEKQERVLERACELYMRIRIGQFDDVADVFMDKSQWGYTERLTLMKDLLRLAAITFFGRGYANGPDVNTNDEQYRCALALYTTLRHARSWHEHPEGGVVTCFDPPINDTLDLDPKCEVLKEEEDGNCG